MIEATFGPPPVDAPALSLQRGRVAPHRAPVWRVCGAFDGLCRALHRFAGSVLEDLDPEIEWRPRPGAAGVRATLYRGHEGVLAYKREVEEALGALKVEVLSIEDLGDCVLAHIRSRGHGSASGVHVEAEGFHLWTMHAGRAVSRCRSNRLGWLLAESGRARLSVV